MPASLDQCHWCSAATSTLCIFPSVIPPHKHSYIRLYADKNAQLQATIRATSPRHSPFPTPCCFGVKGKVSPRKSLWTVPMIIFSSQQRVQHPSQATLGKGEGYHLFWSRRCRDLIGLAPKSHMGSWAQLKGFVAGV